MKSSTERLVRNFIDSVDSDIEVIKMKRNYIQFDYE